MESRRFSIQERRKTRRAFVLILFSIGLLFALLFFGIPNIARFAAFVAGVSSESPTLTEDKTPPAYPKTDQQPKFVKEDKFTLNGTAEARATLKVLRDGSLIKELEIGDSSTFSLDIPLVSGANLISLIAVDSSGNESNPITFYATYDSEAPIIEIENPSDGKSFFGEEKTITIIGKTEAESRVLVNGRLGNSDLEGKFSVSYTLSEGKNELLIEIHDRAGNKSEKNLTVHYAP